MHVMQRVTKCQNRAADEPLTGGDSPAAHGSGDDVRLRLHAVSARLTAEGAPSGGALPSVLESQASTGARIASVHASVWLPDDRHAVSCMWCGIQHQAQRAGTSAKLLAMHVIVVFVTAVLADVQIQMCCCRGIGTTAGPG